MPTPYNLFPLYCTTPMSPQVIGTLLRDSASDPSLTSAEFALVLKRNEQPIILGEENLPSTSSIESDFVGETPQSIARYTAQQFQSHSPISSTISVILDERSTRDATCIIVKSFRTMPAAGVNGKGVGEKDGIQVLHVRIPFSLCGCLFGVHTGLGLMMEDMVECTDTSGVFCL